MLVKITLKRFVILLVVVLFTTWIYLWQTNYWFDRKIEKLASPLLRQVIRDGYYRIGKDKVCPIDASQTTADFDELMLFLVKKNVDITVTTIMVNDCPSASLRVNGTPEVDNVFNNKTEIKCDVERRFELMLKLHSQKMKMLEINNKSHLYSLHRTTKCTNYDILYDNVKKHPGKIIPIMIGDNKNILNGNTSIMEYSGYYYILFITNISPLHLRDKPNERYLIFKKLTLSELMTYDNGSYWKLIKEYGIRI